MHKRIKRIGVSITFMFFWSQASLALARGGGGVGGSLGGSSGRSFSSGSVSGGGLSGGFSHGFNSFSPFPFFFFGGFGRSSSGGSLFGSLLSIILLMVVFYLIVKALYSSRRLGKGRKNKNRGLEKIFNKDSVNNNSGDLPVDLSGRPITNSEPLQRFEKAISFTRENMNYYAQSFPRWDRDFLIGRVRQVFFWLQDAWSRQDLSADTEYLAPALRDKYKADLQGMKTRGEQNMIKEPVLNKEDIEFIHCHFDESAQHFMVMIFASLIDYTLDASGRQISGDSNNRLYFTEFWEFVWQDDRWLLSNIYQEDALEVTKIARGEE